MNKKDLEKEINILEHEIFIERVLTRAMGKNTISLRDHFAGLAMQGLLASPVMGDCALHNSSVDWLKDITKCSYDFADFMMVYRERRDV